MRISRKGALRATAALAGAVVLGSTLTACSGVSTPSAMCGFIVGDGESGHDSKVHKVVWPDQTISDADFDPNKEKAVYVPCNSRNYIINDGTDTNANGGKVGDRDKPTVAYTKDKTQVLVQSRASWTLNQNEDVLRKFYPFCYKYSDCLSPAKEGGNVNSATKGWNDMLGENMGPALDKAIQDAMSTIPDDIWKNQDRKLMDQVGAAVSNAFAEAVRPYIGFSENLFCGSGNSSWPDSNKPGVGEFSCSNVRVTIEKVERKVSTDSNGNVDSEKTQVELNQQRLRIFTALYGSKEAAAYWLGLQDTLDKCKPPATCIVNIGQGQTPVGVNIQTPAK